MSEAGRAERAAWLHLVLTVGLGPTGVRELLGVFGLPEDVLAASRSALARVTGDRLAAAIKQPSAQRDTLIEQALEWAQAPDNHLICLSDPDYPQQLLQIGDPPALLYLRGSLKSLSRPAIAIVGSRSASRGGADTATAFAQSLAQAGLTVVSGLAQGIDTAAHQGALHTPAGTIAVLGTGVDQPYPAGNRQLADAIVAQGGALLAEVPLGTGPRAANFPRRNRLIAGLSLGVLVVEAALRSGSLITARQAGEFGREVFAIPGSIHSPLARGCHLLLKQGARLVESAADVLDELPGLSLLNGAAVTRGDAQSSPPTRHDPVLTAMGWDPVGLDTLASRLAARSGPASQPGALAARLLALELDGLIEQLVDGRYQRRPPL
jgi:DNA processing protein